MSSCLLPDKGLGDFLSWKLHLGTVFISLCEEKLIHQHITIHNTLQYIWICSSRGERFHCSLCFVNLYNYVRGKSFHSLLWHRLLSHQPLQEFPGERAENRSFMSLIGYWKGNADWAQSKPEGQNSSAPAQAEWERWKSQHSLNIRSARMLMTFYHNILSLTPVSISLSGNKYKARGMCRVIFSLLCSSSNRKLATIT